MSGGAHEKRSAFSDNYRRPMLTVPPKEVASALQAAGVSPYSDVGRDAQAFGAWLLAAQASWMAANGRRFPRADARDDRRDYRPRNNYGER